MIKVPERVGWPKFPFKLLSANHFSRVLEQHLQHAKWLCLKPDRHSMFSKFARTQIDLKDPKTDAPERVIHFLYQIVSWTQRECITGTPSPETRTEEVFDNISVYCYLPGEPRCRKGGLAAHCRPALRGSQ